MLPEAQVRRLSPKDVTDLSLSDMLDTLCRGEESGARDYTLCFGGAVKDASDARLDERAIVLLDADGDVAAQAEGRKLLSATVMDGTPESITFMIDETKSEIRLSIYEASCAIVLY